MNIYQRIDAITADLAVVAKNLTVQTGKDRSYKAVGERDIIDAVKPLEHKYGVASFPVSRDILDDEMLESEGTDYKGNPVKRTTFYIKIRTRYRFVNIDEPLEFIETETISDGIDSGDKGAGKAMTYGDKYALMKVYKISTGEDPDQKASEPTEYTKRADQVEQPQTLKQYASEEQLLTIRKLADEAGIDLTAIGEDVETMTAKRADAMIARLKARLGE